LAAIRKSKMRRPKIGDRVAIQAHAVIFIVKSVDETAQTVNLDETVEAGRVEKAILWNKLTFLED
jgi:serine acetyltransferase